MPRILTIALFFLLTPAMLFADEQVTLQWDPNTPGPDQYKLYQRPEGQAYDYSSAVPNPPDHMDGAIPHPQVTQTVTLPTPNPAPPPANNLSAIFSRSDSTIALTWQQGETTASETYYWVVRAEIPPDESGDSNEVSHTVTGSSTVTRWEVFYSLTSGGPWTPLDTVQNTGQSTPTLNTPLTVVPDGERAEVFFTIVSFHSDTLFSANAAETSVIVDRRVLTPPTLSITATIVVQ